MHRHTRTAIIGAVCIGVLWALFGGGEDVRAGVDVKHEEWIAAEISDPLNVAREKHAILRSGDIAFTALMRLGFPSADVSAMIQASRKVYSLRKVRAGRSIIRRYDGKVTHVYYQVDAERLLHLTSRGKGWQARLTSRVVSARQVVLRGEIRSSLFVDAAAAGLDERTTMNMVDLFSWDIDFTRDLRLGDRFTVLLEERFDDRGTLLKSAILAAEFVNQGKTFQAVRYQMADGRVAYFTPDGRSVRKAYLRSPVKFSRISSRFNLKRRHPILGYTRAHRGVDYSAVTGTPVRAVGDGRVVFAGWRGGYGRFVEIRHTNANHVTAYAHLSRYGRYVKRGIRVRQGQVIGYVGRSGLATGPHLHFEFRLRGRAVNPLSVKRAASRPIPVAERKLFRTIADQAITRMRQFTLLAWG